MKARIRNGHGVDLSRLFSAKCVGGVRGFADMCAFECVSNDIFPCLTVFNQFQYIVEPNEEQETGKDDTGGGAYPNSTERG